MAESVWTRTHYEGWENLAKKKGEGGGGGVGGETPWELETGGVGGRGSIRFSSPRRITIT